MIINVHNSDKIIFLHLSTDNYDMPCIYNDTFHEYLEESTATFDFSISKYVNGKLDERLRGFDDSCYISFRQNSHDYLFNIYTWTESDTEIQVSCNFVNLELTNENTVPLLNSEAHGIDWYFEKSDLLVYANAKIGINQVADKSLTLQWEDGDTTKLERLQSIVTQFDAEIEYRVELNRDGTIKNVIYDIYKKYVSGESLGRGADKRSTVLSYGRELTELQVERSKEEMFNSILATGTKTVEKGSGDNKEEVEETIDISDLEISEKNADGVEEFYSRKGSPVLYAPLAMQKYGATANKNNDNWIRKYVTTEYSAPEALKGYMLSELKKHCMPSEEWTATISGAMYGAEVGSDVAKTPENHWLFWAGDVVTLADPNFKVSQNFNKMEARVTEVIRSFTNQSNNSIVISNYVKQTSNLSDRIMQRMADYVKANAPYILTLQTDGGTNFTDSKQLSTITPVTTKNLEKVANVSYRYTIDDKLQKASDRLVVKSTDFNDKSVVKVQAYLDDKVIAEQQLTFTNLYKGLATTKDLSNYATKSEIDTKVKTVDDKIDGLTVGGRNYLRNSAAMKLGSGDWSTGTFRKSMTGTATEVELTDSPVKAVTRGIELVKTSGNEFGIVQDKFEVLPGVWTLSWWIKATEAGKARIQIFWASGVSETVSKLVDVGINWQRVSITLDTNLSGNYSTAYIYWQGGGTATVTAPKLEKGNIATDWSPAPEDTDSKIDEEHQQTQEQLIALSEAAELAKAQLEAKASIDTLEQWVADYKKFVQDNNAYKDESEQRFVQMSERAVQAQHTLNNLAERWDALDSYLEIANEGLILGMADGSSSIKIDPAGRISMFSAGSEVMYISQGVIHIENGIFSKTIQIGNFREEQYDETTNFMNYVGGL